MYNWELTTHFVELKTSSRYSFIVLRRYPNTQNHRNNRTQYYPLRHSIVSKYTMKISSTANLQSHAKKGKTAKIINSYKSGESECLYRGFSSKQFWRGFHLPLTPIWLQRYLEVDVCFSQQQPFALS